MQGVYNANVESLRLEEYQHMDNGMFIDSIQWNVC